MSKTRERKGPEGHRFLVLTLNIILAILVYWLLGFVIDDIGQQPGPDYSQIQKHYQDPALVKQKDILNDQSIKFSQSLETQMQQRSLLQTSINSYRDTMNQLLGLQKASIQKGVAFSTESQLNLTNVTKQYLDYQKRFQDLNSIVAKNNADAQQLRIQISEIDKQLSKQSEEAQKDYNKQLTKHNLSLAGLQLLVLIPLLILVTYIYKKYRTSIYKPMIISVGIALLIKIAMVMQAHFPSQFFKYILIVALIYIIARALISMLRMVAAPKPNWLLMQYREAYLKLQCPLCQYAIQPGVLKFLPSQDRRENWKDLSYLKDIEQYNCPNCGEQLYEKCSACEHTRHSLLIYCDHCGAEKITKDFID